MGMGSWRVGHFSMCLVLVCLGIFVAFDARADGPMVVGLDRLIQMALEKNPQIQEAEQDVVAAQSDLAQAKAGQWAQMDVIATAGPSEDAKVPTISVNPNPGPNGQLRGRIINNDKDSVGIFGRLDIAIVQPLFTFGKISNRQNAAAHGVEAQRAAKEKQRSDVILNVKQLYFGLIVALQGKGAADDAGSFVKDARRRIERLIALRSTNVDQTDLYRIETLEADIQQFRAKADSGARVAYVALQRAVGLSPGQDFQLDTKELPKDTRALGGTQEEYARMALDRRPEIKQLKEGIEARRALLEAAKSDLYPSIFVAAVGSFAGAPGRQRESISYFSDEFNHAQGGVILGSEWHLDLGIGRGKVNKANAEYRKLLYTMEHAERNIPVEVTKYYQDVVEHQTSYQAFEKGSIAARKWVVASFSNFDVGVGTAKDMFDAIDRYGKNQGEYLLSLYNYHVALANLSHAIGEYGTKSP